MSRVHVRIQRRANTVLAIPFRHRNTSITRTSSTLPNRNSNLAPMGSVMWPGIDPLGSRPRSGGPWT